MSSPADHIEQITATLMSRRREGAGWSIGIRGYSLPRFASEPLLIPAEDGATLARYGITLEGEAGSGNVICLDAAQSPLSLVIRVRGCTGTRIVIGAGAPFTGRFAFNGNDSVLMVAGMGQMGGHSAIRLTTGPGCATYLGAGLTSVSSDWIIEGDRSSLVVGDDLMASWGVSVRNFDSHALFDLAERRVINSASDLHIGPHCWIGQDAKILRGVSIGAGAIVGAGALVTGDVPAASAAAGSPARVVRSGVSWTRIPHPSARDMEAVAALLGDVEAD